MFTRRPQATLTCVRRLQVTLTLAKGDPDLHPPGQGRPWSTPASPRVTLSLDGRPRVTLTSAGRRTTSGCTFETSLQHTFGPALAAYSTAAAPRSQPCGGVAYRRPYKQGSSNG